MAVVPVTYHVGIVVSDVEESCEQFSALLGLSWCARQIGASSIEYEGRLVTVEMEFVYSMTGPPYIELIAQRADSPFATLGLNHLGIWTDDPKGESRRFDEHGFLRESVKVDAQGQWSSALFHRNADGVRLELVNVETSGPKLVRYLQGEAPYA